MIQFTFHMGSVAFAAFIIAIFDFIRAVIMIIERGMTEEMKQNCLLRVVFAVTMCCISCIKKTVEIISYYGLVFVAVNGNSFCGGCAKTFGFFSSNAHQCSINALVVFLIRIIAYGVSPLGCAILCWIIVQEEYPKS